MVRRRRWNSLKLLLWFLFQQPHVMSQISGIITGRIAAIKERGLSPATIATGRQSLRKFFKHTRVQQLSKLKIADVERFFVLLAKRGWTLLFTSAFP